jgi:hypothetical protein
MAYRHTNQGTDAVRLTQLPPTDLRFECDPRIDYQDRFRGAIVGTATGDAL